VIATISAFAPIIHDKIVMNATEIPFLVSQARFYSGRQPKQAAAALRRAFGQIYS
jgi:hypothetical protein